MVGYANVPYTYYGFQNAKTGVAFVGMFYWNNNNYFQVKLIDSLKYDMQYYVECYVNLQGKTRLGCNNQSILFTKTATYVDTLNTKLLSANPQITNYDNPIVTDTVNWVKVSGIFKAQGGEQYLTLGNFRTVSNTSYIQINPNGYFGAGYFVDDVAVYALDSFNLQADAGKDTTITIGDSVFIGSYTNGLDSVKWFNGLMVIDSTRPGFWVKPLVNTCYVLTQTVNGYTSSDTVCINVQPLPLKFTDYRLQLTEKGVQFPSSGGARGGSVENLWQTANEINVSHFNILRSNDGINFKIIGSIKAQNKTRNTYSFVDENASEGANYYKIGSIDFDGKMGFSEVRNIEYRTRNNELRIYPNPVKDVVYITSKESIKEVRIVNSLGQVVQQLITNNQSAIINVQGFAKGLYLLKITTSKNNVYNEKLFVQ